MQFAIFTDPCSPDELDQMAEIFTDAFPNASEVYRGFDLLDAINALPDVLIVDYGGLSFGAHDLAFSQVEYALRWAQEHEQGTLLIWSSHTAQLYRECDPHLTQPNVAIRSGIHGGNWIGKLEEACY
jgi:hypothetical protein